MDRTLEHQELEIAQGITMAISQRSADDQWQRNAAMIESSVACAVHGCCDGDWNDEDERSDSLEQGRLTPSI
jgi:hypothetical protein